MAMAVHPATGDLWQGENSRDNINIHMPQLKSDAELPHDELNLIRRGAHYGWPYCYDANLASPEYPSAKCASYTAPTRLLPAHAAPLGMLFYTADRFPAEYKGSLVMTFHGYRQHGHRLVALLPDKQGAPLGKMVELISGWDVKGKQGRGAPVDVKQAANGDLLLVDDHNGQLLKLHFKD
jgi:glucose/arabinose dehydrogenase